MGGSCPPCPPFPPFPTPPVIIMAHFSSPFKKLWPSQTQLSHTACAGIRPFGGPAVSAAPAALPSPCSLNPECVVLLNAHRIYQPTSSIVRRSSSRIVCSISRTQDTAIRGLPLAAIYTVSRSTHTPQLAKSHFYGFTVSLQKMQFRKAREHSSRRRQVVGIYTCAVHHNNANEGS